jgi:hypothetical protein
MSSSSLHQVRKRFEVEGYDEGIRKRTYSKEKGAKGAIKVEIQEVTTLRDYFCHLNII